MAFHADCLFKEGEGVGAGDGLGSLTLHSGPSCSKLTVLLVNVLLKLKL